MKNAYVTIYEGAMQELGLTVKEYYIAETISLLSGSKSITPGWCVMSKANMAKKLGVSSSTVFNLLNQLEDKGLIERKYKGKRKSEVRTTKLWAKTVDDVYKNQSLKSSKSGDKSNSKKQKKNGGGKSSTKGEGDSDSAWVVRQSFVDLYRKEMGMEPMVSYADINRIKEALKFLTEEQLIDYLEARAQDGSIPLHDALNLAFALSSGALNAWRMEIGV